MGASESTEGQEMKINRKSNDSPLPSKDEMAAITEHWVAYPECGGGDVSEKHSLVTGDFSLSCGECGQSL
jgi:hypothetical protein